MKAFVWLTLVGLSGCMATETPEARLHEAQRLIAGLQPSARCASQVTDALAAVDYAHFEESTPDGPRLRAFRAEAALYKARQAAAACDGAPTP